MNRLARERSPYLLQHAGNPVDWYPWGEEAFAKARREDKPIFLSIGYSTCHWCHVMEHESFENREVADALNADFVSIKVDREERPDVDRVYMSFVQSTTGSGGWPMTVMLTPDLKPFFGGTYFPPASKWGRPGFLDLLHEISRVWKHDRARVDFAAAELFDRLRAVTGADGRAHAETALAPPDALAEAVQQYQAAFDRRHGGFGEAPKFPRPSELLFLLREHARTGADVPLAMAVETLRAMATGGMRDHVGGGFHRYSVDAEWRVPHFEKMLYDQAQLVLAYLEGAQASGNQMFAAVAEDTLAYVLRDMRDPRGGFYSAEDADSVPLDLAGAAPADSGVKKEGAFYAWSDAEIASLLGGDAGVVRRRFGIRPEGNAPNDPHDEFKGQNILYTAASIDEIAAETGRSQQEVVDVLGRARQVLFDARARRPRPHLDDKVLTSWNGMMIAACARAARVLPERPHAGAWLEAARRAAQFIRETMWRAADGTLLRRWRDGEASIEGYAEDYSALVWGLLELFQTDGDPSWLDWARELQEQQDARFWDDAEGGWFSTTGHDPSVLLRLKEDYDGAEPSASSVSVLNLLTLAHLRDDEEARRKAERTLARYGERAGRAARVIPMMLAGLSTWHAGATQIVIVGEDGSDLTREIARHYLPFALTIPVRPGAQQQALARALPFVAAMRPLEGAATAFVCRDFTCREPVSDSGALAEQLRRTA
ncbi:MAG TPA: thioredoxin domain-containing protein [Vicinamibacterales bacterium]|nr:thioredoxin domain-containing protein [Vicinamibacterales bacterium]